MNGTRICSIQDCDRDDVIARGLCTMHYARMRLNGRLHEFQFATPASIAERLQAGLVQRPNGCIEWVRKSVTRGGYGVISDGSRQVATHRIAWQLANGQIPVGLNVLHHCDNPPCCNVEHLFLGTKANNTHDMTAKGRHRNQKKTHCIWGHEFTPENTYFYNGGWRACRACHAARRASARAL